MDISKNLMNNDKSLCLYCDKAFSNINDQGNHVERDHKAVLNKSKGSLRKSERITKNLCSENSPFAACFYCNNKKLIKSDDLESLFQHLLAAHKDIYFGCKCKTRLLDKISLANHKKNCELGGGGGGKPSSDEKISEKRKFPKASQSKGCNDLKCDTLSENTVINSNSTAISTDPVAAAATSATNHHSVVKALPTNAINKKSDRSNLKNSNNKNVVNSNEKRNNHNSNNNNNNHNNNNINNSKKNKISNLSSSSSTTSSTSSKTIDEYTIPLTRQKLKEPAVTPTKQASSSQNRTSSNKKVQKNNRSTSAANENNKIVSSANVPSSSSSSSSTKVQRTKTTKVISHNSQSSCESIENIQKNEILNMEFDEDFYKNISNNIRINLNSFIDGKADRLQLSRPVFDRISVSSQSERHADGRQADSIHNNHEKEIHEATNFELSTPFPALLTAEQYGFGDSNPKNKRQITKNSWKWKWDLIKKYKYVNEGGKIVKKVKQITTGLKDLSQLDMWTQLSMRSRYENLNNQNGSTAAFDDGLNDSLSTRLIKTQNVEQLNSILDKRLMPEINIEQLQQTLVKEELVEINEFQDNIDDIGEETEPEILSMVNLAKVDTSKLVNPALSGEWARPRCFVCIDCGQEFDLMKSLNDHKNSEHPYVVSAHYEVVGRENLEHKLYKNLFLPKKALHAKGNADAKLSSIASDSKSNEASSSSDNSFNSSDQKEKECSKCMKTFKYSNDIDVYRHILDCIEDRVWMQAKRRNKYRRSRRKTKKNTRKARLSNDQKKSTSSPFTKETTEGDNSLSNPPTPTPTPPKDDKKPIISKGKTEPYVSDGKSNNDGMNIKSFFRVSKTTPNLPQKIVVQMIEMPQNTHNNSLRHSLRSSTKKQSNTTQCSSKCSANPELSNLLEINNTDETQNDLLTKKEETIKEEGNGNVEDTKTNSSISSISTQIVNTDIRPALTALQIPDTDKMKSLSSPTNSSTSSLVSPTSLVPKKKKKLNDCIAMLTCKIQEKLGVNFFENTTTEIFPTEAIVKKQKEQPQPNIATCASLPQPLFSNIPSFNNPVPIINVEISDVPHSTFSMPEQDEVIDLSIKKKSLEDPIIKNTQSNHKTEKTKDNKSKQKENIKACNDDAEIISIPKCSEEKRIETTFESAEGTRTENLSTKDLEKCNQNEKNKSQEAILAEEPMCENENDKCEIDDSKLELLKLEDMTESFKISIPKNRIPNLNEILENSSVITVNNLKISESERRAFEEQKNRIMQILSKTKKTTTKKTPPKRTPPKKAPMKKSSIQPNKDDLVQNENEIMKGKETEPSIASIELTKINEPITDVSKTEESKKINDSNKEHEKIEENEPETSKTKIETKKSVAAAKILVEKPKPKVMYKFPELTPEREIKKKPEEMEGKSKEIDTSLQESDEKSKQIEKNANNNGEKSKKNVGKTKQVVDKPKKIVEKARKVVEKAKQIEDKPNKFEEDSKKVVEKAKPIEDKPKQIEDKPNKIVDKANKIVDKAKKIEDKSKKIGENIKQIEDKPKQIIDKTKKVEDKPKQIVDIDKPIEDKTKKIVDKAKENEDKPKQVVDKDKQIEDNTKQIVDEAKQLEDNSKQIEDKNMQIVEKVKLIEDKSNQIEEKLEQIEEKAEVNEKIKEIEEKSKETIVDAVIQNKIEQAIKTTNRIRCRRLSVVVDPIIHLSPFHQSNRKIRLTNNSQQNGLYDLLTNDQLFNVITPQLKDEIKKTCAKVTNKAAKNIQNAINEVKAIAGKSIREQTKDKLQTDSVAVTNKTKTKTNTRVNKKTASKKKSKGRRKVATKSKKASLKKQPPEPKIEQVVINSNKPQKGKKPDKQVKAPETKPIIQPSKLSAQIIKATSTQQKEVLKQKNDLTSEKVDLISEKNEISESNTISQEAVTAIQKHSSIPQKMPASPKKNPTASQNLPKSQQKTSAKNQKVSTTSQKIPTMTKKTTKISQKSTKIIQKTSEILENIPSTIKNDPVVEQRDSIILQKDTTITDQKNIMQKAITEPPKKPEKSKPIKSLKKVQAKNKTLKSNSKQRKVWDGDKVSDTAEREGKTNKLKDDKTETLITPMDDTDNKADENNSFDISFSSDTSNENDIPLAKLISINKEKLLKEKDKENQKKELTKEDKDIPEKQQLPVQEGSIKPNLKKKTPVKKASKGNKRSKAQNNKNQKKQDIQEHEIIDDEHKQDMVPEYDDKLEEEKPEIFIENNKMDTSEKVDKCIELDTNIKIESEKPKKIKESKIEKIKSTDISSSSKTTKSEKENLDKMEVFNINEDSFFNDDNDADEKINDLVNNIINSSELVDSENEKNELLKQNLNENQAEAKCLICKRSFKNEKVLEKHNKTTTHLFKVKRREKRIAYQMERELKKEKEKEKLEKIEKDSNIQKQNENQITATSSDETKIFRTKGALKTFENILAYPSNRIPDEINFEQTKELKPLLLTSSEAKTSLTFNSEKKIDAFEFDDDDSKNEDLSRKDKIFDSLFSNIENKLQAAAAASANSAPPLQKYAFPTLTPHDSELESSSTSWDLKHDADIEWDADNNDQPLFANVMKEKFPKKNSVKINKSKETAISIPTKSLIMGKIFKKHRDREKQKTPQADAPNNKPGIKNSLDEIFDHLKNSAEIDDKVLTCPSPKTLLKSTGGTFSPQSSHSNDMLETASQSNSTNNNTNNNNNNNNNNNSSSNNNSNNINNSSNNVNSNNNSNNNKNHNIYAKKPIYASTPDKSTAASSNYEKKSNSRKDINELPKADRTRTEEEEDGIGKRKSRRRCAIKTKTFAETWSSDEYEELHDTNDIISIINEIEKRESIKKRKVSKSESHFVDNNVSKKSDHMEPSIASDGHHNPIQKSNTSILKPSTESTPTDKKLVQHNDSKNEKKKSVQLQFPATSDIFSKVKPVNTIRKRRMSTLKDGHKSDEETFTATKDLKPLKPTISMMKKRRMSCFVPSSVFNDPPKPQTNNKTQKSHASEVLSKTKIDKEIDHKEGDLNDSNDRIVKSQKKILSAVCNNSNSTLNTTTSATAISSKKKVQKHRKRPRNKVKNIAYDSDSDFELNLNRKSKASTFSDSYSEDEEDGDEISHGNNRTNTTSQNSLANKSSNTNELTMIKEPKLLPNDLNVVPTTTPAKAAIPEDINDPTQSACNRTKRHSSEKLYYWSSSSESDVEPGDTADGENEDSMIPQQPEQHGWIVGDSHKKLVTLLAHAKIKNKIN